MAARRAVEAGALVRKAKEQLAAADDFGAAAIKQTARAERLRKAAWAVDRVLAGQIAQLEVPVAIREGRMVVKRATREELAESTGLRLASVCGRVNELLELRMAVENGTRETSSRRKAAVVFAV